MSDLEWSGEAVRKLQATETREEYERIISELPKRSEKS